MSIESEKTRNRLSKPVAMVASVDFDVLAVNLANLLPLDAQVFKPLENSYPKIIWSQTLWSSIHS